MVVTDEGTRELLADAAFNQEHVKNAPLIFVVCANYVRSMSRYGERGILYAMEDATIAGTYLMLACHAAGLGSCWTGAFDDEMIREILDLPDMQGRFLSLLPDIPRRLPLRLTELRQMSIFIRLLVKIY